MATYNQVSYGSNGDDVSELQKLLNQNGYNLKTDGIFGKNTQAAVRDYQQKNGLAVDGIVGKNTWGKLAGGTTPSTTPTKTPSAADEALNLYKQQQANAPGAFQFSNQEQKTDLYNKIKNREDFSFDLNGDALYQQYKDKYIQQGKMAMMDTMGQAQAATGGYGSSYAQSVGQQAYQGHLQQLNDVVPELYQMAYDRYNQEGQDLYNQYALLVDQYNQEYGLYRDAVSDHNTKLNQLWQLYTNQYQIERDAIADEQWQKEFDEAVRQYNERTVSSSGDGFKTGDGKIPGKAPLADTFTGTTYSDAVAFLKSHGVSDTSGIMNHLEWTLIKNSYKANGTGGAEVINYSSYKEYLADIVKYLIKEDEGKSKSTTKKTTTSQSTSKKGGGGGGSKFVKVTLH